MRDRYGEYQLLTGYEAPCRCFWCGCEVTKGRRYCCKEHGDQYHETFIWGYAVPACLKRQDYKCGDCGMPKATTYKEITETDYPHTLLVHHIIPLYGSWRHANILNRPENLVALCPACHGKRHAFQNKPVRPQRPPNFEVARERGQLMFDGLEVQNE